MAERKQWDAIIKDSYLNQCLLSCRFIIKDSYLNECLISWRFIDFSRVFWIYSLTVSWVYILNKASTVVFIRALLATTKDTKQLGRVLRFLVAVITHSDLKTTVIIGDCRGKPQSTVTHTIPSASLGCIRKQAKHEPQGKPVIFSRPWFCFSSCPNYPRGWTVTQSIRWNNNLLRHGWP